MLWYLIFHLASSGKILAFAAPSSCSVSPCANSLLFEIRNTFRPSPARRTMEAQEWAGPASSRDDQGIRTQGSPVGRRS